MCAIFFVTVFVTYIIGAIYKWRQANKWADCIPGGDEAFFDQLPIKLLGAGPKKRIDIIMEYSNRYPKICKFWYGPTIELLTNDPELIKLCFTNPRNSQKPRSYEYFFYGNGLVTAEAKIWKIHRKLLNPSFGTKSVMSFINIFNENIKNLIEKVQKYNRTEFNLLEPMIQVTLDNVCDTSIGVKIDALKNNFPLNKYLQRVVEIVTERQITILYQIPIYFYFTKTRRDDVHARAWLMKFVRDLIEKREKIFDQQLADQNDNFYNIRANEEKYSKTPKIMIDCLLHGHKIDGTFTRKDIEDHVLTMISAGTETSALAISSAILYLGIHQKMQDKLYEEICEYCPIKNDPFIVDYEMIRKMDYLEMIFKETIRLNPSVPNVGRITGDPIPYNGTIIPPGTDIYVSWFSMHRQKSIWGEDAEEFNPDRFLPEHMNERHQFAWTPFSLGVRNCIGYTYAKMSFKISVIQFIRAYKVKTSLKWKDIEWQHDLHLHITKPHLISVEKRE